KKKRFSLVKFKGMGGCGPTSLPPPSSTPAIIRSAAEWETKGGPRKLTAANQKKRPTTNPAAVNVVVDIPDVCCTPPGICITSDFSTRNRKPPPR
ncbi:hypothetical protein M569_02129, partial [Genlisea aurea]